MPNGKKRFNGITHGNSWDEAVSHIGKYHPKRCNIIRNIGEKRNSIG